MSLPLELVREIIHVLLFSAPPRSSTPEDPGCSSKPRWSTVNALSFTSQSYRALVLEAWFRTLYIDSAENLIFLQDSGWFPELGSKWTKHLHCVQSYSNTFNLGNLSSFLRITSIRLDWLSPSLPPDLDTIPFSHISSTVEEFDLRGRMWVEHWNLCGRAWPDPRAIQIVANTPGFGRLKTLKMVQGMVWCGLCHTCCDIRFKDRPTGVVYEGGLGLPIDYARVLAPLEYLEEVVIVIPNHGFGQTTLGSNADSNSDPNADMNSKMTPTSNTNVNPNLWSGECDACMVMMYDDDAFRERWVARKRCVGLACGDGDNDDGQKDVRPPKLRRVEYRFSTLDDGEEEERFEDYEDVDTSDSEFDHNGLEWD